MGSKPGDSKIFYLVLSIFMSIALWLYVITVVNPNGDATVRNIPITVLGEDVLEARGLMITQMSRSTYNLQVTGKRNALLKLSDENVTVTLDVSSLTEEGNWSLKCKATLPTTVTSGTVSASDRNDYSVSVTVAKQASKTIEIRGEFAGQVAEGYQADEFIISPSTVTITGQEDHVNQVAYGVVTVNQNNLTDTYTGEMPFELADSDGNRLTGLNIKTSVDSVYVTLPVVKVAEIPLSVELVDGGGATADNATVTIDPESIVVSGSEEVLAPLKEIILGQVNLADILSVKTYTLSIPLASELTNESGIAEATVTVSVSGLPSKVLEVDNIEIINVPDGYSASAVTKSLQVWVRGTEEALSQIADYQLRVVADLSSVSLSTGQYRVPVRVYLDGGGAAGVVGTDYSISIQLTR